jgi:hypothetical protein
MMRLNILILLVFGISTQLEAGYKSQQAYLSGEAKKSAIDCGHLLMKAVEVNQNINKTKKSNNLLFNRSNIHEKLISFYSDYKKSSKLSKQLRSFDKQKNLQFYSNCQKISKNIHQKCKSTWNDESALLLCTRNQIQAKMLPFLQKVATPKRPKIRKLPKTQ